jgi:hypothetical protein
VRHVGERLGLLVVAPDVALGDHEDDLVARLPEQLLLQEDALALFERLPRVEQEEHGVRARDVRVGDVGALQRQIVHPWRVDQHDALSQDLGRVADLEVGDVARRALFGAAHRELAHGLEGQLAFVAVRVDDARARDLGVLEVVDHRGGGRDARGQHRAPEQRVHERALAVVELAHHDEVETVGLELAHELALEPRQQRARADALRRLAEVAQRSGHFVFLLSEAFEHGGHPHTLMISCTLSSTSLIERPPASPTCSR